MTKTKKELTIVKEAVSQLLKLMGLSETKIKVSQSEEMIKVQLESESPGILIGFKGETIYSLQLILSLIVYKKLGTWQPILVNVADWREQREESLKNLALNTAQKVKLSQQAVVLAYLNAAERRIIHMTLAENPDVITESEGEDNERRLIVKPKSNNSKSNKDD